MSSQPHSVFQNPQAAILLICLLAFALRLGPAFDNRFHPDEALFSSWALKIAHGENFLLNNVPVDKPPLLICLTAISFFFFGQTEIAARFINLAASVISVALLYHLARGQLLTGNWSTGPRAAHRPVDQLTNLPIDQLIPSLLLALSPFAILFAPTAFLDPTMIMFGLASLVAASRGRAGWAGVLLGLSFATKVQGLFFAPLLFVFNPPPRHPKTEKTSWLRDLVVMFSCFALVALIVLAWDRLRGGVPFWVQQTINYGGIRVIYPSEVWPRLKGWLSWLPYFFGSIVGAIGLIGLLILLYLDLTRYARTRAAFVDLALLTILIVLFALHWLLAFPVWDRYFLILVPIAAMLVGRVINQLINSSIGRRISLPLALASVTVAMLPFSYAAAEAQYPIGGDHGVYDGIEQVAAYLSALPSGTVVYDHWLTWELSYYLGEGHVYLAYFDTPAALADDLRVFAKDGVRYVIFPAGELPDKVIDAIGQVGYTLSPVFETKNRFDQTSFTIYRIVKRDA
jgi:4-amino-4-deoxy-L-arabinose transferase-like glycosyltransferase